jgi:hypothetical protein
MTLYAACGELGRLEIRRIRLARDIQEHVLGLFAEQLRAFELLADQEIEYDGVYKPDDDEVLYLDGLPEIALFSAAVARNAVALVLSDEREPVSEIDDQT